MGEKVLPYKRDSVLAGGCVHYVIMLEEHEWE